MERPVRTVLSIAGSDSGGGAGIQADLKAFARCGVHGMTAITAITAQNTTEVRAVHPVPPQVILDQVRAVADDIGVDAVKVGMLGSVATIEAVAQALEDLDPETPVVVDPVMVAESGARLLEAEAQQALVELVLPRATVATPNLPEARQLAGARVAHAQPGEAGGGDAEARRATAREAEELARALLAFGPRAVVVTGGHRDEATDVFFDGTELVEIPGERFPGGAAHGSGCTHSSALAAHLALGLGPLEAARAAKAIAAEAVRNGLAELGRGAGPVDVLGVARAAREAPGRSDAAVTSRSGTGPPPVDAADPRNGRPHHPSTGAARPAADRPSADIAGSLPASPATGVAQPGALP